MNNTYLRWYLLPLYIISMVFYMGCNNPQPQNSITTTIQDTTLRTVPESVTSDTLSHGDISFGLFNATRDQIIVIDDEEPPIEDYDKIKHTWINEQSYKLDFVKVQKESDDYNGRQTPDNFDNVPGAVFKLAAKAKPGDAYVLLCSDSFLKSRKALKIHNNVAYATKSSLVTELKKTYGRSVTNAKLIATTAQKDSIFLAQLAPVGDSLTVVLVTKPLTGKNLLIQEFKAEYNEMSTWRVDDGGEFPMEDFTILNAFEHKGKIELVTSFPGAEGGDLTFLTPGKNNRYHIVKESYVYWSPL
ncbi:hypothetical protein [Sphingobacterium paucimobilis]|nr:hypothetical protein [Sphingobacterium paucimobilis]